jgi:hypothetical protein
MSEIRLSAEPRPIAYITVQAQFCDRCGFAAPGCELYEQNLRLKWHVCKCPSQIVDEPKQLELPI